MSEQLGLPLDGPAPPAKVPDQGQGRRISQVALASLDLPRLEACVLDALRALGDGTMDELAAWLRTNRRDASAWSVASMSGRLNGLAKRGLIFRRGRRPGISGRPQGVWLPRP